MRTMMLALCILMTTVSTATAQDRGVSIPDVYTPDAADAFAAREVTTALRLAGEIVSEWRLSTVDVPLVELMRACGASSDTSASEACMAEMVLTRDPSMAGGLILFAFMERVGEANGYAVILVLYDMREGRITNRIEAPVARIMAPAARNRDAAEWIRRLLDPPHREVIAETSPTAATMPVFVLGIQSIEGDDQVAATISRTLRVTAGNREGWIESDREITLAQMLLAHRCQDIPDRGCLSRISETLQPDDQGLIFFGRMRRQGEGRDDVRLDLVLFDIASDRATHRATFDERMSELIVGGRLDDRAGEWLDRLVSSDTEFEDTGRPYFDPIESPPPGNPHEALEIAGWSLVMVAGASLVAAITSGALQFGVNGDEEYNAYRSSWDASLVPDVCQVALTDMTPEGRHAASVCSDASLYEILVPVFWTVAAAAGVAGALLAWHPWTASAESPTVSLVPAVGPTFVGLDLSGTF